MSLTSDGPNPWIVPPEWSNPVKETLAWRTDVMRANVTGKTYHNSQRITPGRAFDFDVVDSGQAWRVADQLIDAQGGKNFLLPIWPDIQLLATAGTSGATSLACDTVGYDFVDGGKALLWLSVTSWEVISISTVGSGVLNLSVALGANWAIGSRLYPLRLARLADAATETIWGGDDKGTRSLHFDIYDACTWQVATLATYKTHPVLEWRGNDDNDPTRSYNRLLGIVDNGLSDPQIFDLAGISLRGSQFSVVLHGRQEHTDFRGLLYALRGSSSPIWVPTFKADFVVLTQIASSDTTITVEWSAYTALSALSPNRQDIRIELNDGTVFYRRIVSSVESLGNEVLTIDTSLGQIVASSAIRCVSFMVLSTCSDSTEIDHETDASGVGTAQLTFSAVVPDV